MMLKFEMGWIFSIKFNKLMFAIQFCPTPCWWNKQISFPLAPLAIGTSWDVSSHFGPILNVFPFFIMLGSSVYFILHGKWIMGEQFKWWHPAHEWMVQQKFNTHCFVALDEGEDFDITLWYVYQKDQKKVLFPAGYVEKGSRGLQKWKGVKVFVCYFGVQKAPLTLVLSHVRW